MEHLEKLKPILKYQFWILFGVALLLPMYAWWSCEGALQGKIEQQKSKIKTAKGKVPSSTELPNQAWHLGLKRLNQRTEQTIKQSVASLWEAQKQSMAWPPTVVGLMRKIPWHGRIPATTCGIYRNEYAAELDRLWNIVDPYALETEEGKVRFDIDTLAKQEPVNYRDQVFNFRSPTPEEIWHAQEDIWLMQAILESIAEVNDGTTRITDSYIKEIQELRLYGGSRESDIEQDGKTEGEDEPAYTTEVTENWKPVNDTTRVDFDPKEQFGNPGREEEVELPSGAIEVRKYKSRYIDDAEDLPFKTRGFYLKVVMDHRRLPQLLIVLSNMNWVTRIERVHQVDYNREEIGSTDPRRPVRHETENSTSSSSDLASASMKDQNLTVVVIAGLMSIYKPPTPGATTASLDEWSKPASSRVAIAPLETPETKLACSIVHSAIVARRDGKACVLSTCRIAPAYIFQK